MYHIKHRKNNRIRRILKIRSTISGTADMPRLTVFRSNKYIYGTLIDDVANKVVADVSGEVKKIHAKKTKIEAAKLVGELLAEKALAVGCKKAVFDRRGYKFHGRVKSLAEGARAKGLAF